ncbi:MAG: hypothetical protein OXG74_00350 [Acidobacteria bacterium]|nr:hypothetical protein [Acidobacteriota bacterium]
MTGDRHDDFYVGYVDETPPGIGRFARWLAVGLVVLAVALGLGLALLLERFDQGVFEYGTVRHYEGKLLVDPHPRLLTADGPAEGYLLVAEGKHALKVDRRVSVPWEPDPGVEARVTGTLIQNPETAMLEVRTLQVVGAGDDVRPDESRPSSPESGGTVRFQVSGGDPAFEADSEPADGTPIVHIGPESYATYVGEIVDTKCYLGAMKPGRGKPHRDCASLCIRGGIPAALLVRTEKGERALLHLMNALGNPVGPEVLEWVGEPVEITGILRRQHERLVLMVLPHRPAPITSAAAGVRPHRPQPATTVTWQ